MQQFNYETIVRCIEHGAPAIAPSLIKDLNQTVELANDRITELQRQHEAEAAIAAQKKKTTK